ncbi:putative ATP/GTP binding protein [Streptomyces sp. Tu6071]|nr:putative ATP/GTP binding protein [Streptomyces sp. Tu6071]
MPPRAPAPAFPALHGVSAPHGHREHTGPRPAQRGHQRRRQARCVDDGHHGRRQGRPLPVRHHGRRHGGRHRDRGGRRGGAAPRRGGRRRTPGPRRLSPGRRGSGGDGTGDTGRDPGGRQARRVDDGRAGAQPFQRPRVHVEVREPPRPRRRALRLDVARDPRAQPLLVGVQQTCRTGIPAARNPPSISSQYASLSTVCGTTSVPPVTRAPAARSRRRVRATWASAGSSRATRPAASPAAAPRPPRSRRPAPRAGSPPTPVPSWSSRPRRSRPAIRSCADSTGPRSRTDP